MAARPRKLALNSGNWWPLNDAYRHRYSVVGNSDFAIADLQQALERPPENGGLPAKLRQQVAGKDRTYLFRSPKFWREGVRLMRWGEGVRLVFRSEYARKSLAPILMRGTVVAYIWKPAYEKLWPTSPEAAPKRHTREKPPRREPPIYGTIRQKANDLYPQGYDLIPTNVLIDEVYTALGKDAPKRRYQGERALGRRSKR